MSVSNEATDRPTHLAAIALEAAERSKLHRDGDVVIVLVYPSEERTAGVGASGIEDPNDIVVAMFMHLRGIFSALGKRLDFITEDGYLLGPEPESTDADDR